MGRGGGRWKERRETKLEVRGLGLWDRPWREAAGPTRHPRGQSALAKSRLPWASSSHPFFTTSSDRPRHHAVSRAHCFYPKSFQIRELHSPELFASELPVAFLGADRRGRSTPQHLRAQARDPPRSPGATRQACVPDSRKFVWLWRRSDDKWPRRDSNRPFLTSGVPEAKPRVTGVEATTNPALCCRPSVPRPHPPGAGVASVG